MNASKSIITREKYKEIKKYDRQQMERFLTNLYTEGIKDGIEQGKSLHADTGEREQEWFEKGVGEARAMFRTVMDQTLDTTKGIGEKTKALFIENYNRLAVEYCKKIVGVESDGNE